MRERQREREKKKEIHTWRRQEHEPKGRKERMWQRRKASTGKTATGKTATGKTATERH